jgi:tagaturonate reductase
MLNKNNSQFKESYKANLPEKVLQFGTGVLLRGLCDDIINQANKNGIFEGSIIVVKSTGSDVAEFVEQDNLYTIFESGLKNGKQTESFTVNEAISRVLAAQKEWNKIEETAENPALQIVISNATEAGLVYVPEKLQEGTCPESFPGKLTLWLYKRFKTTQTETVIIPTELIVDNGKLLKDFVVKLAEENAFEAPFFKWLNTKVHFCSSLVDRIVPGKPPKEELETLWEKLGYKDNLLIKVEPYTLWAIEGKGIEHILSFIKPFPEKVILAPNIEKYRELKLRLLNAPHTLMSGVGVMLGFKLVKDAMADDFFLKYIYNMMLTELSPAIGLNSLDDKVKQRYIMEVLDRFKNNSIDHKWQSICVNYTLKMKSRVIPLLINYYKKQGSVPHYMVRCFAVFLFYMKAVEKTESGYFGVLDGQNYLINCEQAPYFYDLWKSKNSVEELVITCFENENLWGSNLNNLPCFSENVTSHLSNIRLVGVQDSLFSLNVFA